MTVEQKRSMYNARLAKINAKEINLKSPGVKRKLLRKLRNLDSYSI